MIEIQNYAKFYYLCQNMKNLGKLCRVRSLLVSVLTKQSNAVKLNKFTTFNNFGVDDYFKLLHFKSKDII